MMEAFDVIHSLTCVRFRPKMPSDKAYVNIEHSLYSKSCGYEDNACKAAVGYYGKRLHPLCLGSSCFNCKYNTVIIHELMHILGNFASFGKANSLT